MIGCILFAIFLIGLVILALYCSTWNYVVTIAGVDFLFHTKIDAERFCKEFETLIRNSKEIQELLEEMEKNE